MCGRNSLANEFSDSRLILYKVPPLFWCLSLAGKVVSPSTCSSWDCPEPTFQKYPHTCGRSLIRHICTIWIPFVPVFVSILLCMTHPCESLSQLNSLQSRTFILPCTVSRNFLPNTAESCSLNGLKITLLDCCMVLGRTVGTVFS